MEKKEFVEIVKKYAIEDADTSADDFESVEDKDTLFDIADDAWCNTAIPKLEWTFEDDPKSKYKEVGRDALHEAIEKYGLSRVYKQAFVAAIVKKYKLQFDSHFNCLRRSATPF